MDNYDYVYMGGAQQDQYDHEAYERERRWTTELRTELQRARRTSAAWKDLARGYREMAKLAVDPDRLFAGMVGKALRDPEFGIDSIGRRAVECLAWAFQELLYNHPEGKNYIECSLEAGDGGPPVYVTIQRPGGKTPHQLRMEAEAERDRLRAELEGLKAQGPCRS